MTTGTSEPSATSTPDKMIRTQESVVVLLSSPGNTFGMTSEPTGHYNCRDAKHSSLVKNMCMYSVCGKSSEMVEKCTRDGSVDYEGRHNERMFSDEIVVITIT